MDDLDAEVVAACRVLIAAKGQSRLATSVTPEGRSAVSIADGHVPLLVDYTREDREAKGLRKLVARETAPPPVPDTVLEAAASEALLLLTGASGCGKSTSLLHLALELAGALTGDARWRPDAAGRVVTRNDAGDRVVERWSGPPVVPLWLSVTEPASLRDLLASFGPVGDRILGGAFDRDVVLMIDGAESLGDAGPALLQGLASLSQSVPKLRAIVAADADACQAWRVPPAFARRRIVGLIEAQRLALRDSVRPGLDPQAWSSIGPEVRGHVGYFSLALETGLPMAATPVAAVDRWLGEASRRNAVAAQSLVERGAAAHEGGGIQPALTVEGGDLLLLQRPFIQRQLAASRLAAASPEEIAQRHAADPMKWKVVVSLAAQRVAEAEGGDIDSFVTALIAERAGGVLEAVDHAVVTAAAILGRLPAGRALPATHAAVRAGLGRIVAEGRLPTSLRGEAGRALAREGDPRDLEALVAIAGGPFTMGSAAHPNSAPAHRVTLRPYRIARYPVTNRLYRHFVQATARTWRSQDGLRAERANAPAVDLSWHDARACCAWLTERWRAAGSVAAEESVRLPTEAEWERAARGAGPAEGLVYPWPGDWQADRANSEEAGFNDTCTVGLFPLGRSPDGCDDLAGQVWEWTSTLWGEDMATPRFTYPYVQDGREDVDAPGEVRRVLRGACFLSPREKANCIYRGSLEPEGFWRGNGFRVVVASH